MSAASKETPEKQEPVPIRTDEAAAESIFDPAFMRSKLRLMAGGKTYLDVKWRLVWFRDAFPDGSIETEHIQIDDRIAIFRATATAIKDGTVCGRATDYGSETPGDFRDYIEKASTKAIGRALAALGFGAQFLEEDGESLADTPNDAPTERRTNQAATPEDIREKEMRRLHAIASGNPEKNIPPKFPAENDTPSKHKALHELHVLATGQAGLGDATVSDIKKLCGWLDAQSPDDSQLKIEWAREMAKASTLADLATLREEMSTVAKAAGDRPDALMVLILGRRVEEVKKHMAADKALARTDAAVNRVSGP